MWTQATWMEEGNQLVLSGVDSGESGRQMDEVGERRWGWGLVVAQLALLGFMFLEPDGNLWSVPRWMQAVGEGGRIVGLAVIVLGGARLGKSLRVHPEPSEHATFRRSGPYRFVRHPIYSGVLLLGGAVVLTSGSWEDIVALVGLVGVLSLKTRLEERFLLRRFPEYASYMSQVPRFVPMPRTGLRSG